MLERSEGDRVLLKQIEEAFEDASVPPPDQVVDQVPYLDLERDEITATFRGRKWQDLPYDTLRHESAALCFFTANAYHYYLPAYLRAVISHYDDVDVLPEEIVYSLCPPKEVESTDHYNERMATFTPHQRDALCAFLRWLETEHGADDPLDDAGRARTAFGCT